jgi:hypothetical protein
MQVKIAESLEDLKFIAPVLLQLRPQYSADGLIAQIQSQQKDGYRIAYVQEGVDVLCLAGFLLGQKLPRRNISMSMTSSPVRHTAPAAQGKLLSIGSNNMLKRMAANNFTWTPVSHATGPTSFT